MDPTSHSASFYPRKINSGKAYTQGHLLGVWTVSSLEGLVAECERLAKALLLECNLGEVE